MSGCMIDIIKNTFTIVVCDNTPPVPPKVQFPMKYIHSAKNTSRILYKYILYIAIYYIIL